MVALRYDYGQGMRAVISGASGLLGTALTERLLQDEYEVVHLVRRDANPDAATTEILWDPADPDSVDLSELSSADVIFNFSGAPVAKKWTSDYKKIIYESRITPTETLVEIVRRMDEPPSTFITAGGMAIYGDRGDEPLTDVAEAGDGFLASVAIPWEAATHQASEMGCRTVIARFGAVMTNRGGPLVTLIRPFKMGLGGRLGNGRQWSPWVHLDDTTSALMFMAQTESIDGAVNTVSPGVVRNSEMTKAIGKAVGRPAWGWMPAVVGRMMLGEYLQELGVVSVLAVPEKLLKAGFEFKYTDIQDCLLAELQSD